MQIFMSNEAHEDIDSIFEVCPRMSSSRAAIFLFCFAEAAVSVTPLAPMVMVLPEGFK